jgi:hypothetical protein
LEGITLGSAREGHHAPNVFDELEALLKQGFSPISISHLSGLAQKVYLRYLVTGAHNAALGDIEWPVEVYGQSGSQVEPQHQGTEKHAWNCDRQMASLTLQMRDCLWYYELSRAIVDGDIGRVLEIIRVRVIIAK